MKHIETPPFQFLTHFNLSSPPPNKPKYIHSQFQDGDSLFFPETGSAAGWVTQVDLSTQFFISR